MTDLTSLVVSGYVSAAEWTATSWDGEESVIESVDSGSADSMRSDVLDFLDLLEREGLTAETFARMSPSQVGHDFFLTRNHHGAGFWDRGIGTLGETLTGLADSFGNSELIVDSDGVATLTG